MNLGSRARLTATLAFVSLLGAVHCSGNPEIRISVNPPDAGAAGMPSPVAGSGGMGIELNPPNGNAGDSACDSRNGDVCGGAGNTPVTTCGDGLINVTGELCDDGNIESGDGCTADCAQIESNFACPTPGQPCVSTVKCGDGVIAGSETCDDGNLEGADGCSATCSMEPGWNCEIPGLPCGAKACGDGILVGLEECEYASEAVGSKAGCGADCKIAPGYDCAITLPFACAPTTCGNKIVERGEQCDDGNALAFDGCYKCQNEPSCSQGLCKSVCGDGQRFDDEACDDGNNRDNDGCSSVCVVETGFNCSDIVGQPPDAIRLPVTLRDFVGVDRDLMGHPAHADFNRLNGSGVLGIVDSALGADGRMVYACPGGNCDLNPGHLYTGGATRPNTSSAANFAQWYTDVPGVNFTAPTELVLTRRAGGTYLYNSSELHDNGAGTQIDFFDPLHDQGWVLAGQESATCTPLRNVSFTTETHYWFEYQGGERFEFSGDDDTWVFVNGKLAIDLGGLHTPLNGAFTLDADTDGDGTADSADGTASVTQDLKGALAFSVDFGLKVHGIYEVVMFQAERNECGSNFKVTLKNFNKPRSQCQSTCGDGIVASDELCDDGKNNGSYGGCEPGCKARGPYCGDGTKQAGEECDDGVNLSQYGGCAPGCLSGPRCGDGKVQSGFEACDDGANTGAYGKCAPQCTLGPRCGDGVKQARYEDCDDGNRKNGDGCDANCAVPGVK